MGIFGKKTQQNAKTVTEFSYEGSLFSIFGFIRVGNLVCITRISLFVHVRYRILKFNDKFFYHV